MSHPSASSASGGAPWQDAQMASEDPLTALRDQLLAIEPQDKTNQAEVNIYRKLMTSLQAVFEARERERAEFVEHRKLLQAQLEQAHEHVVTYKQQLELGGAQYQEVLSDRNNLEDEYLADADKVQDLTEENKRLRDELAARDKALEGYNDKVNEMTAKEKTRLHELEVAVRLKCEKENAAMLAEHNDKVRRIIEQYKVMKASMTLMSTNFKACSHTLNEAGTTLKSMVVDKDDEINIDKLHIDQPATDAEMKAAHKLLGFCADCRERGHKTKRSPACSLYKAPASKSKAGAKE